MPDYSKTIIYKLINYDCPESLYVGSTTNFTKRKQDHKKSSYNEKSKRYNLKLYEIIQKNGGWEHWHMIKYVIILVITEEKRNKKKINI